MRYVSDCDWPAERLPNDRSSSLQPLPAFPSIEMESDNLISGLFVRIDRIVWNIYLIYTQSVSGVCFQEQTERESGEKPELPRSGNQERKLQSSTGLVVDWEAGVSRQPVSPKTCRKRCPYGRNCTRLRGKGWVTTAISQGCVSPLLLITRKLFHRLLGDCGGLKN